MYVAAGLLLFVLNVGGSSKKALTRLTSIERSFMAEDNYGNNAIVQGGDCREV